MNIPFRLIATTLVLIVAYLLLPVGPGEAQDATPPAGDPCQTAAGAWPPGPMDPDMMQTPGAMGPGMMTPGAMGPGMMDPGMMGDVDLMVATMLLAHDRVDAALAQAAQTRVADPVLRQLAADVAQARAAEGEQFQAWRERAYPDATTLPLDQMVGMMAGMMGPWLQGTPWPGMDAATMGNPVAALCAASGPADRLFVDALIARDQMAPTMLGMMGPMVTDPELQRAVQDAIAARQRELEQLQAWRQGATDATAAGTPAAAAAGAGPTVESYDIYFEPRELTIPAGTDVTLTLPNEGVTLHNFSIDALGISVDIAAGATETVTINAPAGSYEYYCNVPGHKPAGMVGTLTAQ
jgi:uncharacterized protein (DUF305 family)